MLKTKLYMIIRNHYYQLFDGRIEKSLQKLKNWNHRLIQLVSQCRSVVFVALHRHFGNDPKCCPSGGTQSSLQPYKTISLGILSWYLIAVRTLLDITLHIITDPRSNQPCSSQYPQILLRPSHLLSVKLLSSVQRMCTSAGPPGSGVHW